MSNLCCSYSFDIVQLIKAAVAECEDRSVQAGASREEDDTRRVKLRIGRALLRTMTYTPDTT
jgi:hypothetical protein